MRERSGSCSRPWHERHRVMLPIPSRRRVVALIALACAACTTPPQPRHAWEDRLQGNAIVLLGEVHDNARLHRLRLEVLERAVAAGWRPAIAMEQFDRDRQGEIDRARREAPGDARHLIAAAVTPSRQPGAGWNWDLYRPVVQLALRHGLPLIAANLSNAETTRIVRAGMPAVFDDATIATLGLDRPVDAAWQRAQEREIDEGHCGALPPTVLPKMAQAQMARDAVMALVLRRHAATGVVLLAGDGHVRRDIGVPRWLGPESARIFSVGFLEEGHEVAMAPAFDAVVLAAPAPRDDPCEDFVKQHRSR